MTLFVAFVPGVRDVFHFSVLSWQTYLVGFALIFVPTVVTELYKLIRNAKSKK